MGYWNEDNEWVHEEEHKTFTWRNLIEQLENMPSEKLDKPVEFTDCGGSGSFGRKLKQDKFGDLYIKGN